MTQPELSQDNVYLPLKLINDFLNQTDAQVLATLNTDLTGNPYANGIIGTIMKYRNPSFDASSYQADMNVVANNCIEFLLLRFNKQLDSTVSLVRFIIKVLSLSNLKYLYTLIAYFVRQNFIAPKGSDYDLNWVANNYLTQNSANVPPPSVVPNTNLIPTIEALVYTADSRIVNLKVTISNTTSSAITVTTNRSGVFPLFPSQSFTLKEGEDLLKLNAVATISLSYLTATLSSFLYSTAILAALQ